jgi:hypothetical protein
MADGSTRSWFTTAFCEIEDRWLYRLFFLSVQAQIELRTQRFSSLVSWGVQNVSIPTNSDSWSLCMARSAIAGATFNRR